MELQELINQLQTQIAGLHALEGNTSQLFKQLIVAQFNSTFAEYRAYIEHYIYDNATLTETNDYGAYPEIVRLSGTPQYTYALLNYYKQTGNPSDLAKIETWMNSYVTNPFYTYNLNGTGIHYIPQWVNNETMTENDPTPKLTMYAAITALDLYEITGNRTYKTFAEEIAYQSRNLLPVVDNETDLAFGPSYYSTRSGGEVIGTNRQVSIAWFYSRYARINETYASYVPLIINWCWRSQLPNGGLPYSLNDTAEAAAYTAYQTYFALKAYENLPSVFTETQKTQIQHTINRIREYGPNSAYSNDYLRNVIYAATLIEAMKTGFTTVDLSEDISAYLNAAQDNLVFAYNGIYCESTNYGIRWSMYFLSALYSCYPVYDVFK
jgi:hypothetical protein